MFKNIIENGLSIWSVLLITIFYASLKFLLAFGILKVLNNFIKDPFLEIELGEFLSAFITIFLFLFVFKKIVRATEEKRIPFPKVKLFIFLIVLVLGIRLLDDPFFLYKNILFGEPLLDSSKIDPIGFSLDVLFKAIYIIFLIPIFEELLFRKIIFKSLLKKYSKFWLSAIVSSLLFSITHLSIRNVIPTFLFGIIASFIYHTTRNIWYSISLHIMFNLLWFYLYINPKYYWIIHEKLNLGIGYWLLITVGISLIFIALNQYQKLRIK